MRWQLALYVCEGEMCACVCVCVLVRESMFLTGLDKLWLSSRLILHITLVHMCACMCQQHAHVAPLYYYYYYTLWP